MNKKDKLALLTKVLDGKATEQDKQQIQRSNGAGAVVINYVPGEPKPGPDDVVSFSFKGERVSMPYRDIKAFTRYDPITVVFMPDNHRRKKPVT